MITVTDQFCGAGGSSIGATHVDGVELRLAMNHWRRAIETHATNFPDADHDCADISATDPRRYQATDVLLTSPECTNHSLAKGTSRKATAPHLFESNNEILRRVEAERSRATMWDVPRFAEHHDYKAVIVENVVEARQWSMFPAWWQAMELLGYRGHSVYLNSMFFPPTPQSRDRMYVIWTKRELRAPDLEFRPVGLCVECGDLVGAVQSWKRPDRPWGRYRQQYVYRCPACTHVVEPAYTPAFTAIDWSDLGERIGDRARPLAPATIARIRAGLERYGRIPATTQVNGNTFERRPENAIRYRPVDGPLRTQTATENDALVTPPLLLDPSGNIRPVDRVFTTFRTTTRDAVVVPPFIAELRGGHSDVRPIHEALATIVASGNHHGLVIPPGFIMRNNGGGDEGGWQITPVDEPLRTLTTKGRQSLLVPYNRTGHARDVVEAMGTITGTDRFALVVPVERGSDGDRKKARPVVDPLPTQTARQVQALATAFDAQIPSVDDCGFRMLQPPEIGAGMAFPSTYVVTGNKREQVKQYGNAVTPPIMAALVSRVAAVIH